MKDETKLTITMTDRRPVRIVKTEWPVIASAKAKELGHKEWRLSVRQHSDGRWIVYGVFRPSTERQLRHGLLGASVDDPVTAIRVVATRLVCPRGLADECISSLPPVAI